MLIKNINDWLKEISNNVNTDDIFDLWEDNEEEEDDYTGKPIFYIDLQNVLSEEHKIRIKKINLVPDVYNRLHSVDPYLNSYFIRNLLEQNKPKLYGLRIPYNIVFSVSMDKNLIKLAISREIASFKRSVNIKLRSRLRKIDTINREINLFQNTSNYLHNIDAEYVLNLNVDI